MVSVLFIIITDFFVRKIQNDSAVKGISDLAGLEEILSIYADDIFFVFFAEEFSVLKNGIYDSREKMQI